MIEVEVEGDAWRAALPEAEALCIRAAEAALLPGGAGQGARSAAEGRWGQASKRNSPPPRLGSADAAPPPLRRGGEDIAILLTDDETVRDLNARFRGKDSPTNVLSFPPGEQAGEHLGDIALAYGVCAREAAEQGKPLAEHLTHLVAHGVLHLLGFDHQDDHEAEEMEALEREILQELGVPDPYAADRALRPDADARS